MKWPSGQGVRNLKGNLALARPGRRDPEHGRRRGRSSRGVGLLVTLALAALVLGGCGGDGDDPTATASVVDDLPPAPTSAPLGPPPAGMPEASPIAAASPVTGLTSD